MSILFTGVGLALILLTSDPTMKGLGVTIILTIQAAWFIPGSAKQVATEVTKQLQLSGHIPPPTQQPPAAIVTTTVTTPPTPGVSQ